MSEVKGKFVWYDLMTSDMAAAAAFYDKVVGWSSMDAGMPDRPYQIFSVGKTMVAGLMPSGGAPAAWTGYIGVADVDGFAAQVTAAGGRIYRGPEDIPGIGRFAVVSDPYGATVALFTPKGGESPTEAGNEVGRVGWHELHSENGPAAWEFYASTFGWTKVSEFDMGPMGVYNIFATGGGQVGGIMTKMPQSPMPFWLYYFNVDAIDAATARIKEAGGQVVNGPMEVPGGQWIVQGIDPQGAMFALVAMGR